MWNLQEKQFFFFCDRIGGVQTQSYQSQLTGVTWREDQFASSQKFHQPFHGNV